MINTEENNLLSTSIYGQLIVSDVPTYSPFYNDTQYQQKAFAQFDRNITVFGNIYSRNLTGFSVDVLGNVNGFAPVTINSMTCNGPAYFAYNCPTCDIVPVAGNCLVSKTYVDSTVPAFSIGTVSSLATGSTATVTITGTVYNKTINFGIPIGATGATGPAPNLSVGTITKLAAGSTPTVSISGTNPNYTVNVGLVTGDTGASGTAGSVGATGPSPNLTIGTISKLTAGSTPTATISGTNPNYSLNLGLVTGDSGISGATILGSANTWSQTNTFTGSVVINSQDVNSRFSTLETNTQKISYSTVDVLTTISSTLSLKNVYLNLFSLYFENTNTYLQLTKTNFEGPRLAGYNGGELGYTSAGHFSQRLKWDTTNVTIANTLDSSSTSTGALVIGGGIGVGGTVTAAAMSTASFSLTGSFYLNDNSLYLRSSTDANYYIKYSSTRDGIQIGSYGGGQLCTLNGGLTEIIGWTKDNVYLNKPTVIAGDLRTTGRTYIGIDNPGGGGGDTAYLEYVSVGSDQTTLRLAVGNDSIGAIGDSINLTATGGVGVGIDTPAYSLDVNGNGHFSSSLQVDGVVSASNNQYITNSISTSTFNSETLSSAGTAALIYTCSVTSYSQQMNFTIPFCCYMTGSYGSSMLGHVKLQPNSFSCTVNRDGIYYTSPSVSSSVALSSVYTQMQVYNTGTFTGEQYMCTLSFSFIPAVSNNSSTYTFYLTPTWTTTVLSSPNYFTSMTYGMYLNTTLSTNTKSATGTAVVSFDSTQGTGYVASNFSTTFVNIATGGTNIMDQVKCNKLSATNGLSTDLGYYNYNTGGGGTAQNISMPAYGTYMVFIGHNYNDNNIAGSFMLSAYGGARVFNSYLPPGFNLTVTAYSSQGFTVSASYPSGYTSFLVTYLRLA